MKLLFKIIISLVVINCLVLSSFAMLPPYVYEQMQKESVIKAIATVKKVKVINKSKYSVEKKVTFRLEKDFEKANIPKEFTGKCKSATKFQSYLIGSGELYFDPQKNDRVFVTVTENGGKITGYTLLTPELENKINNNYGEMKFGSDGVYFKPD